MKHELVAPIGIVFLIAGCGGGGSAPLVVSLDPTLSITSNNAMLVSRVAYQSSVDSQQLGEAGGGIPVASANAMYARVDTNLASEAKTSSSSDGSSLVPVPPETADCAISGTQTISGEIADPFTPTLTRGDWFLIQYAACDEGLGEVLNGTTRMDIDAFSGDLLGELFSMTITLTLTNFQVSIFENQSVTPTEVLTSNGAATMTLDALNSPFLSTSINGNSMTVDSNSGSESLTNFASAFTVDGNLIPSPYTTSASATLDTTELSGIIRYSTPEMFQGLGGDYPGSGELLVEGLNSNLRLVADNNVDIRILVDENADGTIDDTIVTTWAGLTAQ